MLRVLGLLNFWFMLLPNLGLFGPDLGNPSYAYLADSGTVALIYLKFGSIRVVQRT